MNETLRICKVCLVEKPLGFFTPDERCKDGRKNICKICRNAIAKKNRLARPDTYLPVARKSYYKNKEKNAPRVKAYRERMRDHYIEKARAWRDEIRLAIFNAYGSECKCCGENIRKFLTIDRVNNDGAAHRKELKGPGGSGMYHWLVKNNFPKGFQTLCYNCNLGKRVNGGKCPHENR